MGGVNVGTLRLALAPLLQMETTQGCRSSAGESKEGQVARQYGQATC